MSWGWGSRQDPCLVHGVLEISKKPLYLPEHTSIMCCFILPRERAVLEGVQVGMQGRSVVRSVSISADGSTLLTDKDAILKRWAEHNNSVLNRPSSVNDSAINILSQMECNVLIDEFPTVTETKKAIQHLSSGKAPGTDAILAEVYKAGGLPIAEKLTELFQCMWRKEAIPQDFKDASIIHLYKRKGNPQV